MQEHARAPRGDQASKLPGDGRSRRRSSRRRTRPEDRGESRSLVRHEIGRPRTTRCESIGRTHAHSMRRTRHRPGTDRRSPNFFRPRPRRAIGPVLDPRREPAASREPQVAQSSIDARRSAQSSRSERLGDLRGVGDDDGDQRVGVDLPAAAAAQRGRRRRRRAARRSAAWWSGGRPWMNRLA